MARQSQSQSSGRGCLTAGIGGAILIALVTGLATGLSTSFGRQIGDRVGAWFECLISECEQAESSEDGKE